MSDEPKRNDWVTPQTILAALGMLGAIGGAWMSFDSRITRVEQVSEYGGARLDRIEAKIDRLVERETIK